MSEHQSIKISTNSRQQSSKSLPKKKKQSSLSLNKNHKKNSSQQQPNYTNHQQSHHNHNYDTASIKSNGSINSHHSKKKQTTIKPNKGLLNKNHHNMLPNLQFRSPQQYHHFNNQQQHQSNFNTIQSQVKNFYAHQNQNKQKTNHVTVFQNQQHLNLNKQLKPPPKFSPFHQLSDKQNSDQEPIVKINEPQYIKKDQIVSNDPKINDHRKKIYQSTSYDQYVQSTYNNPISSPQRTNQPSSRIFGNRNSKQKNKSIQKEQQQRKHSKSKLGGLLRQHRQKNQSKIISNYSGVSIGSLRQQSRITASKPPGNFNHQQMTKIKQIQLNDNSQFDLASDLQLSHSQHKVQNHQKAKQSLKFQFQRQKKKGISISSKNAPAVSIQESSQMIDITGNLVSKSIPRPLQKVAFNKYDQHLQNNSSLNFSKQILEQDKQEFQKKKKIHEKITQHNRKLRQQRQKNQQLRQKEEYDIIKQKQKKQFEAKVQRQKEQFQKQTLEQKRKKQQRNRMQQAEQRQTLRQKQLQRIQKQQRQKQAQELRKIKEQQQLKRIQQQQQYQLQREIQKQRQQTLRRQQKARKQNQQKIFKQRQQQRNTKKFQNLHNAPSTYSKQVSSSSDRSRSKSKEGKRKKQTTIKTSKPISKINNNIHVSPRAERSFYQDQISKQNQNDSHNNKNPIIERQLKIIQDSRYNKVQPLTHVQKQKNQQKIQKQNKRKLIAFSQQEDNVGKYTIRDQLKSQTDVNFYKQSGSILNQNSQKQFSEHSYKRPPSARPPLSKKSVEGSSSNSKSKVKQSSLSKEKASKILKNDKKSNVQQNIKNPKKISLLQLAMKKDSGSQYGRSESSADERSVESRNSNYSKNSKGSKKSLKKQSSIKLKQNILNNKQKPISSDYQYHQPIKTETKMKIEQRKIVSKDVFFINEKGKLVKQDLVIHGNKTYGSPLNDQDMLQKEVYEKMKRSRQKRKSRQRSRSRSQSKYDNKNKTSNSFGMNSNNSRGFATDYDQSYYDGSRVQYKENKLNNLREFMKPNEQIPIRKENKLQNEFYDQYNQQVEVRMGTTTLNDLFSKGAKKNQTNNRGQKNRLDTSASKRSIYRTQTSRSKHQ